MKSIIAALAAIACTVVSAQKITSSRPAMNQVLAAGASTQIVWAPVDGVISTIDLRQGNQAALSFVQTIATNVPANVGSYTWNVPATLPAGTDYALSFGQSPDDTYSPFFAISAGNGTSTPAPNNSAPVAGASDKPTGGAKPTGAASGSASGPGAATKTGAAPSTSPSSAATKNSVAVGAIAVAGAVAAALI